MAKGEFSHGTGCLIAGAFWGAVIVGGYYLLTPSAAERAQAEQELKQEQAVEEKQRAEQQKELERQERIRIASLRTITIDGIVNSERYNDQFTDEFDFSVKSDKYGIVRINASGQEESTYADMIINKNDKVKLKFKDLDPDQVSRLNKDIWRFDYVKILEINGNTKF